MVTNSEYLENECVSHFFRARNRPKGGYFLARCEPVKNATRYRPPSLLNGVARTLNEEDACNSLQVSADCGDYAA